jgi:K+-sensing histidine kinase KdpD
VFELDDLVSSTLERLSPRLEGRPLEVALTDQPIHVDPAFLDEVVTNVLENAIKYTEPGTLLRIRAGGHEAPDGRVRLTIEDAGPGVPAATLPRLFDKFYRVAGERRLSRAGTGIGLAVAKGLIEATGGAISARRSELGGLALDIDLPWAQVPAGIAAGR